MAMFYDQLRTIEAVVNLLLLEYTWSNCSPFNFFSPSSFIIYKTSVNRKLIEERRIARTDNRFERARIIRFRIALATAQI